ncbi:MAG: Long-chain-fatty-acid--CoA ligase [bacterium]|nr:Long-chain-fatty-acid--CoA ligase [bacterium]
MLANTLFDFLSRCSLNYATRDCLIYGETRLNYSYFAKVIERLAAGLAELGLQRGHRLALMLPNVPQFPLVYYALLKLGVVVVPLNVLFKESEIHSAFEEAGADGFIAWEGFSPRLLPAVADLKSCRWQIFFGEKIPPGTIDLTHLLAASMQRFDHLSGDNKTSAGPHDPAVIFFTAGATGLPKGAVFSHANLAAAISACWKNFAVTIDDRFLAVIPLFHSFGQMLALNLPLAVGASTVLLPKFDPPAIVETIAKERITHFVAVPSMFPALLRLAPEPAQLASLKCCLVSGALLQARVRDEFEQRYRIPIYEGYGLAECNPLITAFSAWIPRSPDKACASGFPLKGMEVAVLDAARRQMPDAKIGEIFVRGPWVMQGYMQHGQISTGAFWNEWLPTGDLGMLDREGFLYLVDRKADVIMKSGFPVYPSEVEAVLSQHPKIDECTVIGVPDRVHGEEVKAYIVLRPGQMATKEEMVEFCKIPLAFYKCPRHIEFVEALPHSVTGKVLKHLLREKKPAPVVAPAESRQPLPEAVTAPSAVAPAPDQVAAVAVTAENTSTETMPDNVTTAN